MLVSDWSSDVCSSDLRLVLDDEAPVGEGSPAPRGASGPDHEPLGRPAGESPGETLLRGQARGEQIGRASCRERVYPVGGAGLSTRGLAMDVPCGLSPP